jgi:CheY-like chemotaxis protein
MPVVDVGVRRGLRAMVVDDHVMNRAVLADQLGALGCEVHRAADFTEALLRWITDDFDVVLTDIQLGEGSGLTLAKSLHVLGPVLARPVPVVLAVTGSVVSARAAREAGLDGVLTKPVSRRRLTQALAARWPSFGEAGDTDGPDRAGATTSGAAGGVGTEAGAASSSGDRGATALRDDPYARRLMRDEMAKDLARFRRLLAGRRDEDLTAAREVVHRMRGACRMFGDPVLIARCDQLAGKLAEKLAARRGALAVDAADATDTDRQR